MNKFVSGLLKVYAVAAAWAVTLLLLTGGLLVLKGGLTGDRMQAAWHALRGGLPEPAPAPERKPADGLAEREQILEKRSQELLKLDERVASKLVMIP